MLAQHSPVGPQINSSAVKRAAIALDDADADVEPVLLRRLGQLGNLRAINANRGVKVELELGASLQGAPAQVNMKVRPLGVATQKSLRKHQNLRALGSSFLHQTECALDGGWCVEQD